MNDWYGLFLGNGQQAFVHRMQIQQAFLPVFMQADQPDDIAIFSKTEITEAGDQEVTLYFSPAASVFAKTIPGVAPCGKPSRENLGLEVGNSPAAFGVLFSE